MTYDELPDFFHDPRGGGEFCPQVLSFFLQHASVNMGACANCIVSRRFTNVDVFFYNVDLDA